MLKHLVFYLALLFSFPFQLYASEPQPVLKEAAPMNAVLKAITQESVWLNTSRALVPDDLKGRIILLDFWTFCCINCIHIIPDLHSLEEEFGNDLTVIGVHSAKFANEQDTENIRAAIVRYNLIHPVVNDSQFRIWRDFGVRGWPALVLINPLGAIESAYSGEGNKEAIRDDIKALQKKYAATLNRTALPMALEKNKQPPTFLSFPGKLAFAPSVEGMPMLFIADSGHHRIVGTTLQGDVKLIIGSGKKGSKDGDMKEAEFNTPQGLLYHEGNLFIADTENHLLRKFNIKTGRVETLAGTGKQGQERVVIRQDALTTPLSSPWDVALFPDNQTITIAMAGTHQLWTYDTVKKTVSILAGNGRESIDDGRYPFNSLSQPSGLSGRNNILYFVDSETSSLRKWENGTVETLIGTGLFDFGYQEGGQGQAKLQHPLGLYADEKGAVIADAYNHSLRFYDYATRKITNWAGHGVRGHQNGSLHDATFNEPNTAVKAGNLFYIADTNNHAIRVIDQANDKVTDLALHVNNAARIAEDLPNVTNVGPFAVAANNVTLQLVLPPDWKINKDAPSAVALFGNNTLVKNYSLAEIQAKKLTLPSLSQGHSYRLQGTFYYCEDKAGALCLIKSYDATLTAGAKGAETVTFELK